MSGAEQFNVSSCHSDAVHPVYTYRELMELTLKYSEKSRPILSMPFFVGMIQGFFLEKLPENIFTVTRSQARR